MVNEAIIRDRLEDPIDFTCANAVGFEKGTLLKLSGARIADSVLTKGCAVAGIAAREKIASDGRTQCAVFRRGIFDMICSGAIVMGHSVIAAATYASSNDVMQADTGAASSYSGAAIIGTALETGATNEVIQIAVNIGGGSC